MIKETKKDKRDLSRTDLAHMVTGLRKELKDQIKENRDLLKINEEHKKLNGDLRKENDALITVIDLVRERIMLKQLRLVNEETYNVLHNDLNELLEILERVNEE